MEQTSTTPAPTEPTSLQQTQTVPPQSVETPSTSSSENPNPTPTPTPAAPLPVSTPTATQQNPPSQNLQPAGTLVQLQSQQEKQEQEQPQPPPQQQQKQLPQQQPPSQLPPQQQQQPPPPQQQKQLPQQQPPSQLPPQQQQQPPPQPQQQQQIPQQPPPSQLPPKQQQQQQQQSLPPPQQQQPPPPQQQQPLPPRQQQQQPPQQQHQQPAPQQQQPPPPQLQQQNQALQPQPSLPQAQARPQLNRTRPQLGYSHIPQHIPRLPSSSTSFSPSYSSSPSSSIQRGGLAIGVPAHQPQRPSSQPAPFSTYGQTPFNQHYGLGRNPMGMPDSTTTQVRQSIQGVQTIGNFASLTSSQIRPAGVPQQNQPRGLQQSLRSQSTPANQSSATQPKVQGPGFVKAPTSMASPNAPSPSTPHLIQTSTQPWISSATQGKQMHPSYRQQTKPQNLQQRSHPSQQHHHPMSTVSHQQVASSQQQQQHQQQQQPPPPSSQLHSLQEHYGQQYPSTRPSQSMPHQQLAQRSLGPGNQKMATTTAQAGTTQSGAPNTAGNVDPSESSNHILSKRSIRELLYQIDPSEKLDPEVEDVLMEIAEDFVDSITTAGCSLAKHRKSTTLEAKDILLHLERNWHMTLPGFGGDDIKGYKKQLTNDIHKDRLAAVKKSMAVSDTGTMKSSGGQVAGNVKGHAVKAPATGSPKAHETL